MNSTFHLAIGTMAQGEIPAGDRLLVLVFQVNCPGCFQYALPTAEAIHRQGDRLGLSVLGLSTAFEDFELNTIGNTRALVERGELVGVTRRVLGSERYSNALSFPVATDARMEHGVGETFARNALPGTPTWILLDEERRRYGQWFGRLPIESLARS
ncbi:MAG: hypothetical protein R3F21_23935 [Myxococcota bacterium]